MKITQIIQLENDVVMILTEAGRVYYSTIVWARDNDRVIPRFSKWEEVLTEL